MHFRRMLFLYHSWPTKDRKQNARNQTYCFNNIQLGIRSHKGADHAQSCGYVHRIEKISIGQSWRLKKETGTDQKIKKPMIEKVINFRRKKIKKSYDQTY